MKFAICNETFQDWPFDKAFAFARECGYTGIEFAPFTINKNAYDISAEQRAEVRQQAEDAGLQPVGLHWLLAFTEGYYLTSPEPDVRKRTSEYMAELTRLCSDLGGNILVLGSPMQRNLLPGVSHDQAMEYAAHVLKGAMPVMEDLGVTLALEPLGHEEGDFLRTAALGIELAQMIDGFNWLIMPGVNAQKPLSNEYPPSSPTHPCRHVMLPKDMVKKLPKNRLMSEDEWRGLGVQQSQGWVHYMIHLPEPHILLFRRPITDMAAAKRAATCF